MRCLPMKPLLTIDKFLSIECPTEEEYQELKRKCDLMKIKEAEFKTKQEYFNNQTEIFIQKEEDYESKSLFSNKAK